MTRLWKVMVLAVTLAGGCGGGSSPTLEDACARYAAQLCGQLQACMPGFMWIYGYADASDCVSRTEQTCHISAALPHSGFTPAVIGACASAVASQDCSAALAPSAAPACVARGGSLSVGATCVDGWQCSTGLCAGLQSGCGTCTAPLQRGDACDTNQPLCANGLVCASTAPGSGSFTCQPPAGADGSCTDSGMCQLDMFCAADTNRCTRLPKLNEACDPTLMVLCDPSGSGALCDSTSSTCVAAPTVVHHGDDCSAQNVTCGGNCLAQSDGRQLCEPFAQNGETCGATQGIFCDWGLACQQGQCSTCEVSSTAALERSGAPRARAGARLRVPATLSVPLGAVPRYQRQY